MQELEALKIGERSFWIMEWGLVAAILIQALLYGQGNFKYVAGEIAVLFIASCYNIAADLRKGIWCRSLKAAPRTNLLVSLGFSVGFAVILGVINYVQYGKAEMAVISAAVFFAFVFILCFAALSVLGLIYQKKKEKLENESEEE